MTIQQLLTKLNEAGMTDYEIGKEIDVSQSIINRIRNGKHKTTSYERGNAIRKLYEARCVNPSQENTPPT
jgi:predicted transcriptional regulator